VFQVRELGRCLSHLVDCQISPAGHAFDVRPNEHLIASATRIPVRNAGCELERRGVGPSREARAETCGPDVERAYTGQLTRYVQAVPACGPFTRTVTWVEVPLGTNTMVEPPPLTRPVSKIVLPS